MLGVCWALLSIGLSPLAGTAQARLAGTGDSRMRTPDRQQFGSGVARPESGPSSSAQLCGPSWVTPSL